MKNLTRLFIISGIFILMSFDLNEESKTFSFTRDGDSDPLIELELNHDGTFEFTDLSNPNKEINAKGTYILKGNKIKLENIQSNYKIASVWSIDQRYDCIRSRKALKFTRICSGDCP